MVDIDLVKAMQENATLEVRVIRQGEWHWRCKLAFVVLRIAAWIIDKVIRPFETVIEVEEGG